MPRIELCKYFYKIRVKGVLLGVGRWWGWGSGDGAGAGVWRWVLVLVLELVWNFLNLIINYLIKKMELKLGIVWEMFGGSLKMSKKCLKNV